MTKKENKKKKNIWILKITIIAFIISFIFSFISESAMPKVNIVIGVLLVILFILLGIIFDIIGVAVTSANEEPLHSMSSKRIKGAKKAVKFKKNAEKVSSFCNDVIGDICGIISGSAGVTISFAIAEKIDISEFWVGLFITALIAALTIGGKALGKGIALKNNSKIVYQVAKIISMFEKEKK